MRNEYKLLVGKLYRRGHLEDQEGSRKDNVKINLTEMDFEDDD
jgi:hypothetical protein